MATKPKAILSTHDGREASPITRASNVLFENGQTAQDVLNDNQDAMISPVIENSSSMFKVGQGDNVDYSANVVNGAYESVVLKGKSMVNCIQEPSSQDVVLPYEFEEGRYVTINDTKESGALGVELKGQTLVNLLNFNKIIANVTTYSKDGGKITVSSISERAWTSLDIFIESLKPNTDYILMIDSVSFTHSDNFPSTISVYCRDGNVKLGQLPSQNSNFFKFNTADKDLSLIALRIHATLGSANSATTIVNGLRVLEYQEGMEEWDIPYFEGMASCKMPILHTVGKNLATVSSVRLEGIRSNSGGHSKNIIMKNIPVEEGKTYTISGVGSKSDNMNHISFTRYEHRNPTNSNNHTELWNEIGRDNADTTFTIPKGINYISFTFGNCVYNNNGEAGWLQWDDIQLEEGSVATSYEPHKTSILSLPEEVVLRSLPNGVCDTFNTRTGEYVQRIGELVLDGVTGTQDWQLDGTNETTGISGFYLANSRMSYNFSIENQCVISDKFKTIPFTEWKNRNTEACIDNTGNIAFLVSNSKLSEISSNGFKQYLSQNPVTVQYKLNTPIITKINLPSTLKSWNTTTHIYSEIPENTLYPTLSHSNPTYPVILKPSTKYSIVANSYSNDHTNSTINFNLGGATASTTVGNRVTTITTPSTLSNELLTMSGRGNKLSNVMVIEGEVVGDEPYFEGICDCKSPILSNCGKNLFNKNTVIQGHYNGSDIFYNDSKFITYENPISVIPDTEYIFSNNIQTKYGRVNFYDKNMKILSTIAELNLSPFTTPSGCYFIRISTYRNTGITPSDIEWSQLETGRIATSYEPYKSNILSANGDKIELTQDMFEQGGFSSTIQLPTYEQCKYDSNATVRIRTKDLIKVKPNTVYFVKTTLENLLYNAYFFNSDKRFTGVSSTRIGDTFTTTSECEYISIMCSKRITSEQIKVSDFDDKQFEIREIDKTIVLRSLPNGVCDTLNVETGEYVQRISEVVLDGSVEIVSALSSVNWTNDSVYGVQITPPTNIALATNNDDGKCNVVCDKINFVWSKAEVGSDKEAISYSNNNNVFYCSIYRAKMQEVTVEGFKTYLQQNPITVQYELATPIVSTIDVQRFPYAYKDGHIQLTSGSIAQSLTPIIEYSVPTNRNGQIRSNQKMVEKHQKELDKLQAIILANLVNSQYNQTLTTLKYELSRV